MDRLRRWGLNGTLLAEGQAREVKFRPNDDHDAAVRALDRSARQAGLGMWSC